MQMMPEINLLAAHGDKRRVWVPMLLTYVFMHVEGTLLLMLQHKKSLLSRLLSGVSSQKDYKSTSVCMHQKPWRQL